MNIEIPGLTAKQMTFCDIMWTIDSQPGVESFISTLPKQDQRDCRVLIEMMQLAFLDQVDTVDEASEILSTIARK